MPKYICVLKSTDGKYNICVETDRDFDNWVIIDAETEEVKSSCSDMLEAICILVEMQKEEEKNDD